MPSKYKLSPSSSERFLECTASLPFNTTFTENEHTLKGNLQHRVAFIRLDQVVNNIDHSKEIEKLTDPKNKYASFNNPSLVVYWDDSCAKTVDNYVSYVRQIIKEYKPKKIMFEYKVAMTFHGNKINGVIDVVMILPNDDIFIIDLKTGRNKVDTEDNSQMLMYAFGIIQKMKNDTNALAKRVIISISQSLINNTQAFEYTIDQMVQWYVLQGKPMREINTNNLVFRPSTKACKYCQNRDSCNERIKAGVV